MTEPTAVATELYRALAVGDADAVSALLDTGFVGVTAAGMPLGLGGTYRGPASMMGDFWWRLGRTFRVQAEPERFEASAADATGADHLVVTGTYRGVCRPTGRPVEASFAHLLTVVAGRITQLRQFTDTAAWVAALDGAPRTAPAFPGPHVDDLTTIDYSVTDGVASVILDRPDQRNAIDLAMAEESLAVARAIAADARVRAVLIAGNGPALTVGGDIEYFTAATSGGVGTLAERMTTPFHEAFRVLDRLDAPIVTAVHGAAAGGGLGFVYAADVVVASPDAFFCTAFSGLGLSGDGGGTWHLPRIVGATRARRMYVENLRVDAATAHQWGLVSEIVPAADVRDHALRTAQRLAAGPTRGFARQRRLLRESWSATLSEQLRAESEGIRDTGDSRDTQVAVAAFRTRTRPVFEGR